MSTGVLTGRPTLAAAAGAACIASSATLVRLADVEPATAAVFRCLYALPVLFLLMLREDRRYGPRTRARAAARHGGRRVLRDRPGPVAPRDRLGRRRHRHRAGQPAGGLRRRHRVVAAARAAERPAGRRRAGRAGRGRADLRRRRLRCLRRRPAAGRRLRPGHLGGLRRVPAAAAPGLARPAPGRRAALRRDPGRRGALGGAWGPSPAASTWCRPGRPTAGWSSSPSPRRWSAGCSSRCRCRGWRPR